MSGNETNFAVLESTTALIYQTLVGLNKCYGLDEGQSIWFERDGDVSLNAENSEGSSQTEVKKYSKPLTDNDENFWNTLKNWLSINFQSKKYSSLILLTTQKFGMTSTLNGWNDKSAEERLDIIKKIYSKRNEEEINSENPKNIVALQKKVFESDEQILKSVLAKLFITTEADNLDEIKENIKKKIIGIPQLNRQKYLEGLIGFVYSCAKDKVGWEVSYKQFNEKLEDLCSTYCRKTFTFPLFTGKYASDLEQQEHSEKLFVQKIHDIEHVAEIPDAIGSWLELHNSLNDELSDFPQYREKTNAYQEQLVKQFKKRFDIKKLIATDIIRDSKILYNEIIGETPPPMDSHPAPPLGYKNGLIHEAMDDVDKNLKWRVE